MKAERQRRLAEIREINQRIEAEWRADRAAERLAAKIVREEYKADLRQERQARQAVAQV